MKPKYFIFIFAIALLYACNNGDCPESKDYLIPENEKIKLNKNDTLIYKSNLNNLDTIYIDFISNPKVTINEENEFFCTSLIRRESLLFELILINKDTMPYQTLINLFLTGEKYDKVSQLTKLNGIDFDDSLRIYIDNYIIGDSLYKNVSKFENIDNEIFQIYTNLDYGIIKYCYKNGEEFLLYKYIP